MYSDSEIFLLSPVVFRLALRNTRYTTLSVMGGGGIRFVPPIRVPALQRGEEDQSQNAAGLEIIMQAWQ